MPEILSKHIKSIFNTLLNTLINILTILLNEFLYSWIHILKSYEQKRIAYSAIRMFYKLVIKKDCPYFLNKSRRRKRLPGILTKDEILTILSRITNKKHFLMIALLYSSGLRVSEVVSLKVKDIDLKKLTIHIRNSKSPLYNYNWTSTKLKTS